MRRRVHKHGRPKSRELRILLDGRVSMERTFCAANKMPMQANESNVKAQEGIFAGA
jgi:hypothetical protein